jgi:hypothetical protein
MSSGSLTSTEWLSTSPETIERHTYSGNLDCRGGQTVQDSGVGEYHDAPKETSKGTPRVIRVGIPVTEKVDTWITFNNLLAGDTTLAEEATRILQAAPKWLQR